MDVAVVDDSRDVAGNPDTVVNVVVVVAVDGTCKTSLPK